MFRIKLLESIYIWVQLIRYIWFKHCRSINNRQELYEHSKSPKWEFATSITTYIKQTTSLYLTFDRDLIFWAVTVKFSVDSKSTCSSKTALLFALYEANLALMEGLSSLKLKPDLIACMLEERISTNFNKWWTRNLNSATLGSVTY